MDIISDYYHIWTYITLDSTPYKVGEQDLHGIGLLLDELGEFILEARQVFLGVLHLFGKLHLILLLLCRVGVVVNSAVTAQLQ